MRADAQVNRSRILDAARTALDEQQEPSMAAVARAAGVGQGTLYRHFPSWPDLVMAVHRSDVADLIDAAPRLLVGVDGAEALRRWLSRLADYGRLKKGLPVALAAPLRSRLADEGSAPMVEAIDLLLHAGAADGTLQGGLTGADVLALVSFLWRPDADEQRSTRLLEVILTGLRSTEPSAGSAIRTEPPSVAPPRR